MNWHFFELNNKAPVISIYNYIYASTLEYSEVHQLILCVFISVINQLDAQNFLFYNKFISRLYMFRAHVLIIRRSKLYYTASGIITILTS